MDSTNVSMSDNAEEEEKADEAEESSVSSSWVSIPVQADKSLLSESLPLPTLPKSEFDFEILRAKILKSYKQISISRRMRKFYKRRYQLFNKFDDGILLDLESWYSVTPERVAQHLARQCLFGLTSKSNCNKRRRCVSSWTVLDGFCGSGGNTIQFAKLFDRVIACDIDFVKLQCAQHNARVYHVENKCHFLMQDFFSLHKTLAKKNDTLSFDIDCIFLSPPWGGVNYVQQREADISEFPLDGFRIFTYCVQQLKCPNIVYFLPRNTSLEQILYLAGPGGRVVLEQNFLEHKLVAITAFYGFSK